MGPRLGWIPREGAGSRAFLQVLLPLAQISTFDASFVARLFRKGRRPQVGYKGRRVCKQHAKWVGSCGPRCTDLSDPVVPLTRGGKRRSAFPRLVVQSSTRGRPEPTCDRVLLSLNYNSQAARGSRPPCSASVGSNWPPREGDWRSPGRREALGASKAGRRVRPLLCGCESRAVLCRAGEGGGVLGVEMGCRRGRGEQRGVVGGEGRSGRDLERSEITWGSRTRVVLEAKWNY